MGIPSSVNGVHPEVLNPSVAWEDKASFHETSRHLCQLFAENFKQYEDGSTDNLAVWPDVDDDDTVGCRGAECAASCRGPDPTGSALLWIECASGRRGRRSCIIHIHSRI